VSGFECRLTESCRVEERLPELSVVIMINKRMTGHEMLCMTDLGSRPRRLADDPIPFHLRQDLVIDHIVKPGKVVVDIL
jgi:hypothetical protein